jgi:hypothetical protein
MSTNPGPRELRVVGCELGVRRQDRAQPVTHNPQLSTLNPQPPNKNTVETGAVAREISMFRLDV